MNHMSNAGRQAGQTQPDERDLHNQTQQEAGAYIPGGASDGKEETQSSNETLTDPGAKRNDYGRSGQTTGDQGTNPDAIPLSNDETIGNP